MYLTYREILAREHGLVKASAVGAAPVLLDQVVDLIALDIKRERDVVADDLESRIVEQMIDVPFRAGHSLFRSLRSASIHDRMHCLRRGTDGDVPLALQLPVQAPDDLVGLASADSENFLHVLRRYKLCLHVDSASFDE